MTLMKRTLTALISCGSLVWSFGAIAQVDTLQTGGQAIVSDMTGPQEFAGYQFELSNFSGVFGMSSDTAFVVTAAGRAVLGELKAKPGEVLILTPYGGEPVKEFFDAERLLAAWTPVQAGTEQAASDAIVLVSLEAVKKKQKRAKFFGLYQPTNFNVAAPGSKSVELARRSVVGSEAIQNIRFSNITDPGAVERKVLSTFRDALIKGDAETVASLMDPTPYGGSDLRGGAGGARLLRAQQLIKSKNWGRLLSSGEISQTEDEALWSVSNGINRVDIRLRPIGDFTYISNIQQGA